jgi:Family of unknown function (DUF5681)
MPTSRLDSAPQINPPPRIRRAAPFPPVAAISFPEETTDAVANLTAPDTVSTDVAESATTYEVGYGKPPTKSRFQKGQSGNPNGRPKDAKSLKTIVRKGLLEKVMVRTGEGSKKITRLEALFLKQLEAAAKGNMRALEKVFIMFQNTESSQTMAMAEDEYLAATPLTATDEATLIAFRERILSELSASDEAGSAS